VFLVNLRRLEFPVRLADLVNLLQVNLVRLPDPVQAKLLRLHLPGLVSLEYLGLLEFPVRLADLGNLLPAHLAHLPDPVQAKLHLLHQPGL
jgi:hypothetical protein